MDPWIRKIPWRRKWQPSPIFLPEKSHGQRNLAGYSPYGHKRVGHNLVTNNKNNKQDLYAIMKESSPLCFTLTPQT